MEEKITVTICTGTACYVMGGAELLMLEEIIPTEWKSKVKIVGSPCFEMCNKASVVGKAPYIDIDGEVIAQATLDVAMERLRQKMMERGMI